MKVDKVKILKELKKINENMHVSHDKELRGVIFFDEDIAAFRVNIENELHNMIPLTFEIIGNIYENPELLESDKS